MRVHGQTSPDATFFLKRAQKIFFVAADALVPAWLYTLNPNVESLHDHYAVGKDRRTTYEDMVNCVLADVRRGLDVCMVTYGHPGVFAYPTHEAIRRAKAEGYQAVMLPGISAEDCLFADLGVDPGSDGCQSFEATDFLVYKRVFDNRSALILWQVGVIGERSFKTNLDIWNRSGLRVLTEVLIDHYGAEHEVTFYEAARLPICDPVILKMPLHAAAEVNIGGIATLYVPPLTSALPDPEMRRRLGLNDE
jgi:uncharacterized protein YabN with tetrapyrrole methylase and pyrophosphatase domain